MKTLNKLKQTSSDNEKLVILEQGLNDVNEYLIRKALNDEVFGLSTKTLMKVFNIKSLKGYEDVGDWIDKKYKGNYINSKVDVNGLDKLFNRCKHLSGNNLIYYLQSINLVFDKNNLIWIYRALLKDLKISMGVTQVNKVFKKLNKPLIETFQVQLCKSLKISELDKLNSYPYYCETKYDGTRIIAFIKPLEKNRIKDLDLFTFNELSVDEIEIMLKSRQGKDCTKQFPEVVSGLKKFAKENKLNNTILDGEIISKDFNSLQKRLGRKQNNIDLDESLKYVVFDIINYEGKNLKDKSFSDRKEFYRKFNFIKEVDYSNGKLCFNKSEIELFYKLNCDNDEEGIVVKDLQGTYATEKKDERKGMWKLKPVETMDLKIVDIEYGTGRHSNTIGSLRLSNNDGTIICDCGSGLSDSERFKLFSLHINNLLLNRIVEIKYWEINKPNEKGISSLRFPIYVCLREDKNESD